MRRIAYSRPDGKTAIVTPVINTKGEAKGFSEADAEQRAWSRLPKDAINPVWVESSDIPTDRTFRDALKLDMTHDIKKEQA